MAPATADPQLEPDSAADDDQLKTRLFWVAVAALVVVAAILTVTLSVLLEQHRTGLELAAQGAGAEAMVSFTMVTRSWDISIVTICSVLLAFALVFLGAMHVLRVGRHGLVFSVTGAGEQSFRTSSPGLALAALGVVLIIAVFVFFARASPIQIRSETSTAAPVEVIEQGETKPAVISPPPGAEVSSR